MSRKASKQLLRKIFTATLLLLVSTWTLAQTSLSFNLSAQPFIIGPGSTTKLVFDINNNTSAVVDSMAFTLNLPASPGSVNIGEVAINGCDGILTAPMGGTIISLVDGELSGSSSCQIEVSITANTAGSHTIPATTLTSSVGSVISNTEDLEVFTDRPGFTQSFSSSTVNRGERTTLTYLIDNTLNASDALYLAFVNDLPTGLVFASPHNTNSTCGDSEFTIDSNHQKFTMNDSQSFILVAGTSCTVSVDLKAAGVGVITNQSGDLTALTLPGFTTLNSGFSEASIESVSGDVLLQKEFTNDPVSPGGMVNLEYSISNLDRNTAVNQLAFDDDLNAALSGLLVTGLPLSNVCGIGSNLDFVGGVLSLTGGQLPSEGTCDFSVALQVPLAATPGPYPSASGFITYDRDGSASIGNTATDTLFVTQAPIIEKVFLNDPVSAGESVDLEFTITSTSQTSQTTNISFIDELTTFLPSPLSVTMPASGFCGAGSTMSLIPLSTDGFGLNMTGGSLAVATSCTFVVTIDIPLDMPSGTYVNTTDPVSATVDGAVVTGNQAVDSLVVVAAPRLIKSFIDDPVLPGDTVTLQFTLSHGLEESTNATNIGFTDDLNATLAGLVATGLPMNDVCGTGSSISGTSLLTLTGGVLAPGETCNFSVTLQVPGGATFGSYPNTTSAVTATVSGIVVSSLAASDELILAGMDFTITNTPDVTVAGAAETFDLTFDLTNLSPVDDATNISASLNLSAAIPGLSAITLPAAGSCGAGSQVIGTSFLIFMGGNLTAGSNCTFSVQVQVPASAAVGDYNLLTSALTYESGGVAVISAPASDGLSVEEGLVFDKTFINDPVNAGDTVTLSFDIINNSASLAATAITFTDDLDAMLSGLVAVGLPMNDVCGSGSVLSGTDVLTLTGGNLAAGASCQFNVNLQVPVSAAGGSYPNTTSDISSLMNGGIVSGNAATDELQISALSLSKAFATDVAAGSTVDLTFNLVNEDASSFQSGIRFTDDLNAMIAGAIAIGLPMSDVCGAGSLLSGTDVITLLAGTLNPSESCQFTVTVSIPAGTAAGPYLNVTSDVLSDLQGGDPATDTLLVASAPTFSKFFSVVEANLDQSLMLSFEIDNSASSLPANNVTFIDNFPAGLELASPPNVVHNCTGGTVTAVSGTSTFSYVGGSVAANTSCQIDVDVIGTSAGVKNNVSGDLTSSLGNSGPASDSIEIIGAPLFSKSFSSPQASLNQVITLTLTIDNTALALPISGIDFVDNFPAGLVVASPANATTSCVGGTLTAASGSNSVSYTGGGLADNAVCDVVVDVVGTQSGVISNVTGDLTSSGGNSGVATADVEIFGALVITKTFGEIEVNAGDLVDVNFTIQNNNAVPVTAVSFSDDLDAFIAGSVAVGLPQNDLCGLGSSMTGTNIISLSAGQLAAGETCVITVSVQIPANVNGSFVNQTSPISYIINGNPVIDEPNTAGSASLSVLGEPVAVPMNQYIYLMLLIMLLATFYHFKRMRRL